MIWPTLVSRGQALLLEERVWLIAICGVVLLECHFTYDVLEFYCVVYTLAYHFNGHIVFNVIDHASIILLVHVHMW